MLDANEIKQLITRDVAVDIFDEIDSTNAEAKRRAVAWETAED